MQFASKPYRHILRDIVMSPFNLIPENTAAPILSGQLRGKKWLIESTRKACWLGIYEKPFQQLLAEHLRSSKVFYDIGAHVGFYSLLASGLMSSGIVYSFEPVPRNVFYLRRHLSLNNAGNVRVMQIAISDHDGSDAFQEVSDRASGHLGSGSLPVDVRSIDSLLVRQELAPPDCMKIDVEGEELKLLRGATACVTRYKPTIFLGTHSEQLYVECKGLLCDLGYSLKTVQNLRNGRADLMALPSGAT